MKNKILLQYDFTFGDFQAKVSDQAKLYYIKLMFFASDGFVSSPLQVLDSMGYDKSVLYELINAGELLSLHNRQEVFITSYYVHNNGIHYASWLKSPYAQYWKGKLWTKQNGVATLKPQEKKNSENVVETQPLVEQPAPISTEQQENENIEQFFK